MAKFLVNPESSELTWEDDTSYFFYNSRWPTAILCQLESLQAQISHHPSRIWMMTSGSQAFPKCIGLSKAGVLAAAESVAKKFNFSANEVWLNGLPLFHIGGLSIWARAFASKQKVIVHSGWQAQEFLRTLEKEKVNWASLVPTQVYDLVQLKINAPESLRGVFVGGGPLGAALYRAARELKWPVLPTYGMTEASSQVATSALEVLKADAPPQLEILDHVVAISGDDGRIGISGASVVNLMAQLGLDEWRIFDPRDSSGIYWTQDMGEIHHGMISLKGRADDTKKIRGELVSLTQIQSRLDQSLLELGRNLGPLIVFVPDERTGYKVTLVVEPHDWKDIREVQTKLREKCAPYEQIERLYVISKIPKSDLGKPKYSELEKILLNPKS